MVRGNQYYFLTLLVATIFAAFFVVGGSSSAQTSRSEAERVLGVVYADGRQTEDIDLLKLEAESEELFISGYSLARVFKATRHWNPGARKLLLSISGHRFMFTVDTRVVIVDDHPVMMRMPVRYDNGLVMIPIEFISGILAPRSGEKIELDAERLVLTIGSPEYNVTGLEFIDEENWSKAVLDLTEELLYHVDSETPGLLRVKIYGGKLNSLKFSATSGKGLFNRIRAEQTEHDAYLFFDVKRSAARFRVEFLENREEDDTGKKLIIYLEKTKLPEIPDPDYAGMKMTEILDRKKALIGRISKIAIDPGHGGIDKGKVSPSGLNEKDINLEYSMILRDRLIEELGVEVILTRTEDILIPLSRRAEIANSEGADLFISIHCNGWFHPDAGGFETFFLAPARSEDDLRLAEEENASVKFENPELQPKELEELDFILWDMVQNEFISESSELAELIQKEMSTLVDIRNRGVKQAGLLVLRGLRMPAVLVEVAFLSNPEEEELLQDPLFKARVVEGIVKAVGRLQEKYTENASALR
ncbi:MAG: N-acetylmuramoyl-L-alanine amidase [Candidatus Krumholzibacteriota bacterium]|nr:N-acetylmuramoyl-L-alanine amidase [Candidatus Krumholzibacteriota bacterium]